MISRKAPGSMCVFGWAGGREPLAPDLGEALGFLYPPTHHREGCSAKWSIRGEGAAAGRVAERWVDMQGLKCLDFLRTPLIHVLSPWSTTAPCLLPIWFTGPGVLLALPRALCLTFCCTSHMENLGKCKACPSNCCFFRYCLPDGELCLGIAFPLQPGRHVLLLP